MADPISSVSGLASGIQWRDLVDQIVKMETARRLDPLTRAQEADKTTISAWSSYQSVVAALRDASAKIASQSALGAATASVGTTPSGRSLLSASATAAATPGSYSVQVDALATAEKVQSTVFASSSVALGLAGSFSINGSTIDVTAADTLAAIRDRINTANTGATATHVSASILTGADGSARLILSSETTGAEGIRLIDGTSESSGILTALGFLDGTTSLNVGESGAARSHGFTPTTAILASVIGVTPGPPSFIYVDGVAVPVDLTVDSLSSIAARINAAGGHASLSSNHLEISGSLAGSDARTLELLGFTRAGRGSVQQSAVTSSALTMADASPLAGSALLTGLTGGVVAGDTIAIRGTRADGSVANATFTVGAMSTVDDLLAAVSSALSFPGRAAAATLDGGSIRVTDSQGGESRLAFSLVANNQNGGTLAFGGTTVTDVGRLRQLVAGADAQIRVDGTLVRRSSNSISDVIAGVTLNLQSVEANAAVSLVVERDLAAAVSSMKALATAYNGALAFVNQQKLNGGPLAHAATLRATLSTFRHGLLDDVAGLDANGGITRGIQVGVTVDKNGLLQVDETVLKAALTSNAPAVHRLFANVASASGPDLTPPLWTKATQPGTYTVHVTSPATAATATSAAFANYVAGGAGSDSLAITDSVTNKTIDVTIADGTSIDTVVSALNAAFDAEGASLVATNVAGQVVLESETYGSAPTFTVSGAAGGSLAGLATVTAGTDITGYFRAGATTYAATGKGQLLTGNATTDAEGLSARYTGALADADVGTVTVSLGIAGAIERATNAVIRPNDGTIALRTAALADHAESLNHRVDSAQERLDRYRASLIRQYTAMEAALSRLQSQQSWLTSQINSMNKSNG